MVMGLAIQVFRPEQVLSEKNLIVTSLASQDTTLEKVREENGTVRIAEDLMRLEAKINRTFNYLARLKQIAENTQITTLNTTTLKDLVQRVRGHLDKAILHLKELNIQGATTEYRNAKILVNQLLAAYLRLSTDVRAVKTTNFLIAAENRFPQIKQNVTLTATQLSASERNATLTALGNAEKSLITARELVDEQKIPETVGALIDFVQELNKSLEYVNAVSTESNLGTSK